MKSLICDVDDYDDENKTYWKLKLIGISPNRNWQKQYSRWHTATASLHHEHISFLSFFGLNSIFRSLWGAEDVTDLIRMIGSSSPGSGWEFFSSPPDPNRSWAHPAPVQWVPGAIFLGVKRPGSKADHSPPSSAEVKNVWSYKSTPPIRLNGVVLKLKHRDNFTFTFCCMWCYHWRNEHLFPANNP
jgi:hypothetical protein